VAGPGLGDRGLQQQRPPCSLRLVADDEAVVDVPPKLSARARLFSTGRGGKTDTTDSHSVALVGTRMAGLRPVVDDQLLTVLRVPAPASRKERTAPKSQDLLTVLA
jgi:hypothetical protein